MKSLKLTDGWRLTLTSAGNLATVEGTPRVAQDVASYERTFRAEPIYAVDRGVPYFSRELANLPQNELVIARANAAALEVPGVATVQTILGTLEGRTLTGDIRVTTTDGEVINVAV